MTKNKKTPLQTVTKLSDRLTFGKHKGMTVGDVVILYPHYVLWLDEERIVRFPRRILEKAAKANAAQIQSLRPRHFYEMNGWDGELDD